jgi:hypothetical protein
MHVICPSPSPQSAPARLAARPTCGERIPTARKGRVHNRGTAFQPTCGLTVISNGETAMQPFRDPMTTHYSPWDSDPSGQRGCAAGVASHGGVCVRPRQSNMADGTTWICDAAAETGAVRLQIDCIATFLIEVEGGLCGLSSSGLVALGSRRGQRQRHTRKNGVTGPRKPPSCAQRAVVTCQ